MNVRQMKTRLEQVLLHKRYTLEELENEIINTLGVWVGHAQTITGNKPYDNELHFMLDNGTMIKVYYLDTNQDTHFITELSII